MKYCTVGDWRLSRIGLGCYGLSGAYGIVDKAAFARTLRAAIEQGVNFFDTAEGYGDAETFLGQVLAPVRDRVYIATKLSGTGGQPDLSSGAVRSACQASLRRLGTEMIDLYQIHFDDPHTPVLETVAALDDLVKEGLIRRYGVSHLPVERVLAYAESGTLFSILMELSSVARGALDTLLPICEQHNLAAIAFSVTGRGILSGHFESGHHFAEGDIRRMDPLFKRECFDAAVRVREHLAKLGEAYGATAVQMGIAWVLAQPQVACALTGTSSPAHLAENLAASEIDLAQEHLDTLNAFLAQEDSRLADAQRVTVRQILEGPLVTDLEAAFNDLVYVMETAVSLGMAEEGVVMATFLELFSLRGALDENARRQMQGIQQYLRGMLIGD
ncbi:MAG: aldo/keto reductase [Brevefilum sp.]|nr:aldo/keto reductase [Brevefilum sp.]